MLTHLSLHQFALAEHIELDFDHGLTVLTGETGAGKSLLLDGLAACLGERADSQSVRFGQDKADVSASFDPSALPAVQAWLAERELLDPQHAGDPVLLRRVLMANGRSKGWINGRSVSMGDLRELGALLVRINGQHSPQQLLSSSYAQEWLDVAAQLHSDAQAVAAAYRAWQHAKLSHQRALQAEQQRLDRLLLLQAQLDDVASLAELDYSQIEQEFDRLSHFELMMQDVALSLDALDGEHSSILGVLASTLKRLDSHAQRDPQLADAHGLLCQAQADLQDAIRQLQRHSEQQPFDAERLAQLNDQIAEFHRLARKYRSTPASITQQAHTWHAELQQLQQQHSPSQREAAMHAAQAHYHTLAEQLDHARRRAAPLLAAQLMEQVRQLALPEVQFEFAFSSHSSPQADGLSEIQLLFSANRGMPLQALHKTASGGELSRVALVMQVLTAHQQAAPVLVFDEVDVGISGGTAEIVGRLLRQLGSSMQVLCITHQAQVAAQGHQHLLVEKCQNAQATSQIRVLSADERVLELARMAGGVAISEHTLGHARQLFEQAQTQAPV